MLMEQLIVRSGGEDAIDDLQWIGIRARMVSLLLPLQWFDFAGRGRELKWCGVLTGRGSFSTAKIPGAGASVDQSERPF